MGTIMAGGTEAMETETTETATAEMATATAAPEEPMTITEMPAETPIIQGEPEPERHPVPGGGRGIRAGAGTG